MAIFQILEAWKEKIRWKISIKRDRNQRYSAIELSIAKRNNLNISYITPIHLMLVNSWGFSMALMNLYLCFIWWTFFSILDPKIYGRDRFFKKWHEMILIAFPFSGSSHRDFNLSIVYLLVFFSVLMYSINWATLQFPRFSFSKSL